ncbi:MAG: 2-C-methyl-D-erythritol 2,4-cyclodiphosphate synthase [Actinomycetota bacterium]|jgi:2-C-methyl-D-erythritol 2,4-cyclodiphosphate synthase
MADLRFGLGFDAHPRDEGRPLFLGGLRWEDQPGLAGHSDGDVVCHALADAMLGAAALGDLGERFPESAPELAGVAGPELLRRSADLVRGAGFDPHQLDLVVLAARPIVGPRRDEIRTALSDALALPTERISVKATRPEGLGLSGDGAACLALAVLAPRGT